MGGNHQAGIGRLAPVPVAVALAVLVGACSGDDGGGTGDDGGDTTETTEADEADEAAVELPADYEGYESTVYADDARWLCKPALADGVCQRDLDATAVHADGTTELQAHEVAVDPPVDCFYVYPTVSNDEAANSDFQPGEGEEIVTAYNQVARLTSSCRVFAPIYRQLTLTRLLEGLSGGGDQGDDQDGPDPRRVAYDDVVDSFRHYVANESDGRGFVLIGHSQGAGLLSRLVADEIDDEPLLRDRLVGAYLLGGSVAVPEGGVVGGDFASVPLCESDDQTGCVVSYASFRSDVPPPGNSFFGRAGGAGQRAACVNPADPSGAGGLTELEPYFNIDPPDGTLLGDPQPFADEARTSEITTPWVTYPGLIEAECVSEGEFTYLSLHVNGDPADPRTDDIGGDLTPEWGMHLVDVNVAMGNIVDLVASQAEAYAEA